MKKKSYILTVFILLIGLTACGGYKPIFGSKNLNFKIIDTKITGDKKLAKKIYRQLQSISESNKNNESARSISISIDITKEKKSTVKDMSGKIQQYKIILSTDVVIKDVINNKEILRKNFNYSSSFEVQGQYSETKSLENQITENLINKTYQNLLIQFSEII